MLKVNMIKVVELLKKGYEECGTYRALADKIGRDVATVHNIISGKNISVDLETLNDIAKYFRIPTADLLEGEALDKLRGLPPELQKQIEEIWMKR